MNGYGLALPCALKASGGVVCARARFYRPVDAVHAKGVHAYGDHPRNP